MLCSTTPKTHTVRFFGEPSAAATLLQTGPTGTNVNDSRGSGSHRLGLAIRDTQ
jgi:hypothetical protein